MKQWLLFLPPLFFLAQLSAQTTISSDNTEKGVALEVTTLPSARLPITDSYAKAVIDTFLSPGLQLACGASPSIFSPTGSAGYVTGTNQFFDITKGQRIEFPANFTFNVTEVLAAFVVDSLADATDLLDDIKIVAKVYRDDGELDADDFLGDSDSIRLGDLGLSGSTFSFTYLPFSTPVNVVDASSIIVSIDLINVYRVSPGTAGHIGIVSTGSGCGSGTNAFESFIDTSGVERFFTIADNWGGLNIELYMGAVIDREPLTSTRTPQADYNTIVSPNPATDRVQLRFSALGGSTPRAKLLSADGRQVRQAELNPTATDLAWNLRDLPAGLYLYQLAGSAGVQTGKLIVK